jgi:hypothetical protein
MAFEGAILIKSPGEAGAEIAFDGMPSDNVAVEETSVLQQ